MIDKADQRLIVDFLRKKMKSIESLNDDAWRKRYGKTFGDVKILTNEVMGSEYNRDESKGWTGSMSFVKKKPKDSNVVLLITYDGAGYDYFSMESEHAIMMSALEKFLKQKFGDRYTLEHYTNWALQIYDNEGKVK